jgi:hypothetical protein
MGQPLRDAQHPVDAIRDLIPTYARLQVPMHDIATLRLAAALLAAVSISAPARAHSPMGVDPSLAPWFQALQQPNGGGSCCNDRDCELVQARVTPKGWEALVDKAWLAVPPERLLQRHDNPTGSAVLCHIEKMFSASFHRWRCDVESRLEARIEGLGRDLSP